MTKVRKVKRRKRFRVNVNRKRLRNKMRRLPTIGCPQIKEAWKASISTRTNLSEMGLAYDPNEVIKIPNTTKDTIKEAVSKIKQVEDEDDTDMDEQPPKLHVAESLKAESKAPRPRLFRLPNSQVQFITYLMDKYGEDFKAMARDKKNYDQMTWKQIRAKIKVFMGIPEQYNEYLEKKNGQ